jgi:uncharacterized damage-inducible protein DinB
MDARVVPLAMLYQLNTDLLMNSLVDLSDREAQTRLEAGGNSITFLAAHLTDSRHFLVTRLEHPLSNPLARYLQDVRSIDDITEWPSLDELRAEWLRIGAHLQTVLSDLTVDELAETNIHRFPVEDTSRLGLIAFLVQHDSYHLGQVAFLRRQLGKPPMSYARNVGLTPAGGSVR